MSIKLLKLVISGVPWLSVRGQVKSCRMFFKYSFFKASVFIPEIREGVIILVSIFTTVSESENPQSGALTITLHLSILSCFAYPSTKLWCAKVVSGEFCREFIVSLVILGAHVVTNSIARFINQYLMHRGLSNLSL
ncbi:hypothetical protein BX661DRAFT_181011 [Kickxella alabastrina]|uniref:uncharacterized protein n=1 Tax=Kickxella alabastrina TaxID=61397 RepID=UPI002220230C|nr:uncharacterized protein BX661DRAFT_181011 [Kickxella alabastrina]KAI7830058.1 hypothetical protein BX661DRAFT_181011 [Kickxella alabastrina]